MKRLVRICRNIPFALSAGAYLLLAVPATEIGLVAGILLTTACFVGGCSCQVFGIIRRKTQQKGIGLLLAQCAF